MIAVLATLLFTEDHTLEKVFYVISFLIDDIEVPLFGELPQGVFSAQAFLVRVNILVIEKTHHLKSFLPKRFERIYGAWRAANMKQYFHDCKIEKNRVGVKANTGLTGSNGNAGP